MLWCFKFSEASPFDCECCTDADREARNCLNCRGLPDEAKMVVEYTAEIKDIIRRSGAKKVISLGSMRLYECPLSYISLDTREIIELVALAADTGRLLYGGGWAVQPVWFVEAYQIFRTENARRLKDAGDDK